MPKNKEPGLSANYQGSQDYEKIPNERENQTKTMQINKIPSLICAIVPLRDVDMSFPNHLKQSICDLNKIIQLKLHTFYII